MMEEYKINQYSCLPGNPAFKWNLQCHSLDLHLKSRKAVSFLSTSATDFHSRPCKGIQDHPRQFWIPSHGFRILCQWKLDFGFQVSGFIRHSSSCIGGFHVISSPPCWWTVNKRSLISSFCLSTSICSFHHCYWCVPRLHENHLFRIPDSTARICLIPDSTRKKFPDSFTWGEPVLSTQL